MVGWSRSLTPARAAELGDRHAASLEELAARSQILSLHLALTERTRHIVNRRILGLLPERAMLINTARADLVDYEALCSRRSRSAGLRVGARRLSRTSRAASKTFADAGPASARIASGGLVYGTPHIAAATDQAQLAIATETVRVIRSFLLEATVPNVVNVSSSSAARFQLVIRMMDKVGTFANVLAVLKRHGINVEEVTNTVFEGGVAACAKLRLLLAPDRGVPGGDQGVRRGASRRPGDAADARVMSRRGARARGARSRRGSVLAALPARCERAASATAAARRRAVATARRRRREPRRRRRSATRVPRSDAGTADDAIPPTSSDELTARARHLLEAIAQGQRRPRERTSSSRATAGSRRATPPIPARSGRSASPRPSGKSVHALSRRHKELDRAQFVVARARARVVPGDAAAPRLEEAALDRDGLAAHVRRRRAHAHARRSAR